MVFLAREVPDLAGESGFYGRDLIMKKSEKIQKSTMAASSSSFYFFLVAVVVATTTTVVAFQGGSLLDGSGSLELGGTTSGA